MIFQVKNNLFTKQIKLIFLNYFFIILIYTNIKKYFTIPNTLLISQYIYIYYKTNKVEFEMSR
jgi:hypothetical protein